MAGSLLYLTTSQEGEQLADVIVRAVKELAAPARLPGEVTGTAGPP
jgi:hypothetical protein